MFAAAFPPTPHGIPVGWLRSAGILVLTSLITQHGFPINSEWTSWLNRLNIVLALVFGADLVLALVRNANWRHVLALRRFEYLLLGGFACLLAASSGAPPDTRQSLVDFLHLGTTRELNLSLVKLFLLFSVCIQLLRGMQRLFGKETRPELILGGSIACLILVGTLLLLLPNSRTVSSKPLHFVDAFFTATSAACVTGLTVGDIGTDFSPFGHTVIFVLFQVGGLGIITFVAFLSVLSVRSLPVPQMVAFRQIVNAPALSDLKRQIVGIFLIAGIIELVGAILIYQFAPIEGNSLARIKWSVFHSVSAFCNAGFSLHSNNLIPFQANAGLIITLMMLIILGGLGFLVIPELLSYEYTRTRFFRRFGFFRRLHAGQTPGRMTVQTKIALVTTGILLVTGLVVFWILEYNYVLRDRSLRDSFLIAAFQSVTARTAGFNSVPIQELTDATLVFVIMLMVIGANPVSTGGGVKTVGFAILLLALRAMVARRDRVEAFGRTIPVQTLLAALSVFVIYVITASVGMFLLSLFDPGMRLQDQAFEVISALSTVGLSTGITADLSPSSKMVLCALMFIGRIGPISLVLSIIQSRRTLTYRFPEEEVVVG